MLDRSGVTLFYDVLEGSGPPLVLLHGAMGSSEMWHFEGYVDDLCDAFRLVLVDLRGHGRSDAPREPAAYSIEAFVGDLVAVLDTLGLRSAALCGFSLGGSIALAFAARHPERCDAAVNLDGGLRWLGFEDTPEPEPGPVIEASERFEHEGMGWAVAPLVSEGRPAWARMAERADALAMSALFRTFEAPPRVPGLRLRDMTVPLILVWAEQSVATEPGLPQSAQVVVIPGADHVGVVEHREIVVPLLRSLAT